MKHSFGIHRVKTRKVHDCVWCGESISLGWIAVVHEYITDNSEFARDYWHSDCEFICKYHDIDDFEPHSQPRGEYDPERT